MTTIPRRKSNTVAMTYRMDSWIMLTITGCFTGILTRKCGHNTVFLRYSTGRKPGSF
jgi:hypothetical protein